jgi:hypothetical protein
MKKRISTYVKVLVRIIILQGRPISSQTSCMAFLISLAKARSGVIQASASRCWFGGYKYPDVY